MKLDEYGRKVMHSGEVTTSFTATLNGAAFELISNNIYTHKIAAVVREIACNAFDSHVEAGKADVPFTVTLPSMFSPNLVIEDYGIGLDDDGVRNVFASYFNSSKNHTNELIGGKGIGAKSIFAYSDTFSIVARKDGVERHYTAFIGSEGIPQVSSIGEPVTTDKCNGVKVVIPVQERDFDDFKSEAEVILSCFPTLPDVIGADFNFIHTSMYEQIERRGYALINYITASDLYTRNRIYILMGGVIYPVPSVIEWDVNDFIRKLSDSKSIVIPFNIGEIPTSASRESLSLDEKTRRAIVERINDIVVGIRAKWQDEIDQCANKLEAVKKVVSAFGAANLTLFTYKNVNLDKISLSHYLTGDGDLTFRKKNFNTRSKVTKWVTLHKNFLTIVKHEKTIAFYAEKGADKKYSRNKFRRRIKDYCDDVSNSVYSHRDTLVVVFHKPITELSRKRYDALLGGDVEWVENSEMSSYDVVSSSRSNGLSYDNGQKGGTTFYCKSFSWWNCKVDNVSHFELGDINKLVVIDSDYFDSKWVERNMRNIKRVVNDPYYPILYLNKSKIESLKKKFPKIEMIDMEGYLREIAKSKEDEYLAYKLNSIRNSKIQDIDRNIIRILRNSSVEEHLELVHELDNVISNRVYDGNDLSFLSGYFEERDVVDDEMDALMDKYKNLRGQYTQLVDIFETCGLTYRLSNDQQALLVKAFEFAKAANVI